MSSVPQERLAVPGPGPAAQPRRIRAVYLADIMADVRMVEGFAERFLLTFVAPAALGERISTWPATGSFSRALLAGGRAAFLARAVRWLIRHRNDYDVVIVLDNVRAAGAATVASLITRKPVVLQVGKLTVDYYRCRRLTGAMSGPAYWLGLVALKAIVAINERRAAALAAISTAAAAQCARHNDNTVIVRWYGVDTEVFSAARTRAEAREALGLPQEPALLFFRSRMSPEKDHDSFLRAAAQLRAGGRDVVALYVGGEYREFQAMCERAGVPVIARDAVHPLRELPLYYRASDVTVQTSHAEGLGMSPLESLACEVPIVVSAVGGLTDVADGGRTGALVPPRDHRAVAEAIARLLDDPEEAAAIAKRGRALVEERFSTEKAFGDWEALAASVAAPAGTLTDDMRAFWDRAAKENAQWYVWAATPYDRPDDRAFWESGVADATPVLEILPVRPRRMLEVGCGVGRMSAVFARACDELHAVDISAEMAAQAEANLAERGLSATFHVGDASDLPALVGDARFDTAVCHLVLQHIPDERAQLATIAGMAALVEDGGQVYFQVPTNKPGAAGRTQRALRRTLARARRTARRVARRGGGPVGLEEPFWWRSAVDLDRLLPHLAG
ncbi:MAG: glycosyltransferase, partial [Vicinamibacteria bacterium]